MSETRTQRGSKGSHGADELRVTEIFLSLQGEGRDVGIPTAFIRLTGCPLRCDYCDTEYAFQGGERLSVDDVLGRIVRYGVSHVCVTGGEPLAQHGCLGLLRRLCDSGYQVVLETSGALDVSPVDRRVIKVIDLKTPGSGESARNHWDNLHFLGPHDQIKFVIRDREDYEWARDVVEQNALPARAEILFSPVHGELDPGQLADWILADRLPVRMQIQLHKYLWGDVPGR